MFKIWAMITLVILLVSVFIPYKEWSGKLTGMICKSMNGLREYFTIGRLHLLSHIWQPRKYEYIADENGEAIDENYRTVVRDH